MRKFFGIAMAIGAICFGSGLCFDSWRLAAFGAYVMWAFNEIDATYYLDAWKREKK